MSKKAEREASIVRIKEHLKFHDREYYGLALSIPSLKRRLAEAGINPEGISLGRVAREACQFYFSREYKGATRVPTATSHNGRKWDRALG
ncbi:MAG TPA: hypothetical protein VGN72_01285 [Tepidisphaeraceae bacterium]|jgi:hypothetical protein|nr:hypothetical protein [Tepidisphaeraceae bacterium]